MTDQVIHNWQPSKRLLALIEKNKDSDLVYDTVEERLLGKVKTRTYRSVVWAFKSGFLPSNMTWEQLINILNDNTETKYFMARINGFGAKALSDLRQALKNESKA